jgi:hypothetical protein
MLDLYADYLICSTSHTTATGLSQVTDNAISHDKVTRFLATSDFRPADLWALVKPFVRSIEQDDGVIIFDDSISEKPYTDENDLVSWHYDHKTGQTIKGINFLTALLAGGKQVCPITYALVKKTIEVVNKKTGKKTKKSTISKHEHFRAMLEKLVDNQIKFKHVLADTWFSSAENMIFTKEKLGKNFIMPLKSNRKVALSEENQNAKIFVRIDSVRPGEDTLVWLEGVDFPLRFACQVFKNEDGSTGVLYLVSSDQELSNEQIATIYKRRWKIEVYHDSLKNNASLEKSPAKIPKTQESHFFAALYAFVKLEKLSITNELNHFAVKQKIYIQSVKAAFKEIFRLRNSPRRPKTQTEICPACFA